MPKGKHSKEQKNARKAWIVAVCMLALAVLALASLALYLAADQGVERSKLSSTEAGELESSINTALDATDESITDTQASAQEVEAAYTSSMVLGEPSSSAEAAKEQLSSTRENASSDSSSTPGGSQAEPANKSGEVTAKNIIAQAPTGAKISTFSLVKDQAMPQIPPETSEALLDACTPIEEAGYRCSAILIDTVSARGIAYNAGEPIYTASSFKAALSDYLLENHLASEWEYSNIEASILYSDNDAFESLATAHMDQQYQDWLAAHAIEYDDWSPWYPHASAIGMAACWADIFHFIESNENDAEWFKELLAHTNVSFIRNALEGERVAVWNKGGWLSDPEYNAVADCGIIESDGHRYILCVLTNQPSAGETQARVYEVIRALWACRESLR